MTQDAPDAARTAYTIGLLAALALHAVILFGVRGGPPLFEQVKYAVEAADTSVEVSLVAALPAEEPAPVVEPPPEPIALPPEPVPPPIVEPPPPEKPPEMALPEPAPAPPPKPPRAQLPKTPPKAPPVRAARPVGDGSSPIPGNDPTTAKAAAGAAATRPGYLSNPHPAYPETARAARQQGTVSLRVSVDAGGRVTAVRITHSSGHPSLDERAQSTVSQRWRFKPARLDGVPVASEVIVPIRFTLGR